MRDDVNPDTTFTTYTGELLIKITITIKSTIPTSTVIDCGATADVDDGSGVSYAEDAEVVASRSGSTATCTVPIPYSWALSTGSDDAVDIQYGAGFGVTAAAAAIPEFAAAGANATAGTEIERLSLHYAISIFVPANGATTTERVAVTM